MSALTPLVAKLQNTATALAIGAVVIFLITFTLRSALKFGKATERAIFGIALIFWAWYCVTHYLQG